MGKNLDDILKEIIELNLKFLLKYIKCNKNTIYLLCDENI